MGSELSELLEALCKGLVDEGLGLVWARYSDGLVELRRGEDFCVVLGLVGSVVRCTFYVVDVHDGVRCWGGDLISSFDVRDPGLFDGVVDLCKRYGGG